jgi:hypothetical protein
VTFPKKCRKSTEKFFFGDFSEKMFIHDFPTEISEINSIKRRFIFHSFIAGLMEDPYTLKTDQKWLCYDPDSVDGTKMYLPVKQALCKCEWTETRPLCDDLSILLVKDFAELEVKQKAPSTVQLYRLVYAFRHKKVEKKKIALRWVFLGLSDQAVPEPVFSLFVLKEQPHINKVPDYDATTFIENEDLKEIFCNTFDAIHGRSNHQDGNKTGRWNSAVSFFVPLTITPITPHASSASTNEQVLVNPVSYQSDWSRFRGFLRWNESRKLWLTDSAASAASTVIKFDPHFAKMLSICGVKKNTPALIGKYGVSKEAERDFHVADGIKEVKPFDPDIFCCDPSSFKEKICFEKLSEAILGLRQSLKETNSKLERIFTDEEAVLMEGLIAEKFYSNHGFRMDGYKEMARDEFKIQNAAFDVDQVVHEMRDIRLPKEYEKETNHDFLVAMDKLITEEVIFVLLCSIHSFLDL